MSNQRIINDPVEYPLLTNNPRNPFNEIDIPDYTHLNHKKPQNPSNSSKNNSNPFVNNDKLNKINSNVGTASPISTSFNILKGIIGVGILTLPWAMSNIGLIPSIILLTISFVLSYISWIFLYILCSSLHVYTYRDIGSVLYGNKFGILLDIILLIFLYLVCILYVVFLSEFLCNGLREFNININLNISFNNLYLCKTLKQFILTKFFLITISIFFILFPLSLLNKLDSLKYSSFLGIIGCGYSVGLIVFYFFDQSDHNGYWINDSVSMINYHNNSIFYGANQSDKYIWYWLSSFSIFVASFNTHFNCPALYGELDNKSKNKYINITSISFTIVLLINIICAICGYFIFGIYVNQNILYSLNKLGIIVGIARLIMTLTIIGSYPLLFWNIKLSLKNIINLILYKLNNNNNNDLTSYYSEVLIYFICTVTIWIFSIIARDVAVLITFLQSLLGNCIVFVFPSLFYLKLLKNNQIQNNKKNI